MTYIPVPYILLPRQYNIYIPVPYIPPQHQYRIYMFTKRAQVIPTVGRSDQGAYYCEADNGLGQAGKAELQVRKIQIQEIQIQIQQLQIGQAGKAELQVKNLFLFKVNIF